MNNSQSDNAKIFMTGQSQAVRLPKQFRFKIGTKEVTVRQVGRHLLLSPKFDDWVDFWSNTSRPDDDFIHALDTRRQTEQTDTKRVAFD